MSKVRMYRSSTKVNSISQDKIDAIHRANLENQSEWTSSSDWKISVMEKKLSSNHKTVFIKNQETLEFLLNIKTSAAEGFIIPSFFELFEVGFCFEATYGGISMNGFLACLSDMRKFSKWNQEYANHVGGNVNFSNADDKKFVSVVVGSKKQAQFSLFSKSSLKALLAVEVDSLSNYVDKVYDYSSLRKYDRELPENAKKLNILMAKLIINIAIFNAATKDEYLIEGLPEELENNGFFKKSNGDTFERRVHFFDISLTNYSKNQSSSSKQTHIRKAHFRNLKHERYYRNNNLEVGSKWIEVRSSFVKGKSYVQSS